MTKKEKNTPLTIALTAGGTGGHIFPATSTARTLIANGHRLHFLTDARGTKWTGDLAEIPVYNVKSSAVLGGGIIKKIRAVLSIGTGFLQARKHLKKIKPDVVVGFGGYPSVPSVLAAASLGYKIILHEQNAYAGRANRLLARFADKIATAFDKVYGVPSEKCIVTGNPIRLEIASVRKEQYSIPKNSPITILITGGSQGAEIFGTILPQALLAFKDKIHLIHQVRQEQLESVKAFYNKNNISANVMPFIADMAAAFSKSHIAIGRSGAGSVMENATVGIPSILVPYKYAADNHQYFNAKALENAGGAILIQQDDFTVENIQKALRPLLESPTYSLLKDMAKSSRNFAICDASEKLVSTIEKL